jgi:hypothetical protein
LFKGISTWYFTWVYVMLIRLTPSYYSFSIALPPYYPISFSACYTIFALRCNAFQYYSLSSSLPPPHSSLRQTHYYNLQSCSLSFSLSLYIYMYKIICVFMYTFIF